MDFPTSLSYGWRLPIMLQTPAQCQPLRSRSSIRGRFMASELSLATFRPPRFWVISIQKRNKNALVFNQKFGIIVVRLLLL